MKKNRPTVRLGRDTVFRIAFVLGLAVILLFELWFSDFGVKKGVRVDLTPEGLYTLSDAMKKECAFLADDSVIGEGETVKAIFCADPDTLIASDMSRSVYFMALALQERFPKFRVETVNITENPTAVAKYRTASLSSIRPSALILDYGGNYRIASPASFWRQSSEELYSFDGEYKMASLLLSLTLVDKPAAYFLTGHGETVDGEKAAALHALLEERSLRVKTLNLSEIDEVPQDAVLLIINDPQEDFSADASKLASLQYRTDTEKIDRFLVGRQGALMVTKSPERSLPILEEYLSEWGIGFGKEVISEEDGESGGKTVKGAYLTREDGAKTDLIAQYVTDENTTPYAIYSSYSTMSSAPRSVVPNTGSVYCSFIGNTRKVNEPGAANTAREYETFFRTTGLAATLSDGTKAPFDLCALVNRTATDRETNESTHAYIFAAASGDFLSSDVLGNDSYANYDILSLTVKTIAFGEAFASSEVGGISLNSGNFGGKLLVSEKLTATGTKDHAAFTGGMKTFLTVFAVLMPTAAAVAGVWTAIRRRYR